MHPLVEQIDRYWRRGDHTATIAVLVEIPESKVYAIVNEIIRRRHDQDRSTQVNR